MTLVKAKPKRPTVEHKRRVGNHHRHSNHYLKTYWPYLPVAAILALGIIGNTWLAHLHRDVLGYATDMSIQSLLDDTNTQRSNAGETSLRLNAALDQAAQAKANDMAARDYWSHNTPDGQTPWTFITAAGYSYTTAGENLAYGFATAADTLTGWMNSPEHRDNILNTSFQEVGFGIVNIPDYRGTGPETLVVAMYASPTVTATPAPVVARQTPRPTSIAAKPAPAPQPAPQPTPTSDTVTPSSSPISTTQTKPTSSTPAISEPAPRRITQFQLVASNTPLNSLAFTMLGFAAFAFIVIRHGFAWRRVFVRGEAFIMHHPLLDVAAVSLASLVLVLSHTAGLIR